jgi:CDP-glucose 4,6-dehydratase
MDFLNTYNGKKVLITGHTGFKGSWLTVWLNMLGANVIGYALDPIYDDGIFGSSKIGNKIIDYRADIRDVNKLFEILDREKPEIVFHLGAQALVLESYQSPLETFEINTMGTVNVLEAIRLTESVKTAIFITTDKVYENKEWIWPYREDESMGGYDPYSASKGAAELIISSYRNSFFNPEEYLKHGKSIASVRAGNVIGGGDWSANRIIPDCIKCLQNNKDIVVRSPKSVRPWQHVLEPLGGYLLLGAKMMENPVSFSESWNFGPEIENIINVEELVNKIIISYGKGSWKDLSDSNAPHEAKLLSLDINKANYKLGWRPVLGINETIEYTTEWYKNYQSESVLTLTENQIKKYLTLWKLKNGN